MLKKILIISSLSLVTGLIINISLRSILLATAFIIITLIVYEKLEKE